MKTPILNTDRLILRPFYIEDAQDVFVCWESDPDVAKYMLWESHNDINKTIQWVENEISKICSYNWYRWAILLKKTNKLIGTGLIYIDEDHGKFEISYNLGKKYWGYGYTTEAMNEIIQFAKHELNLKEIVARHAKENYASGRILEKLDFTYVRDIPYKCNYDKSPLQGKEYILNL